MEDVKEGVVPEEQMDYSKLMRMPDKFAAINRMIMRDLNGRNAKPQFYMYTREQVSRFLKNPAQYEKELRRAVTYLYGASSHFRRLIQYFVALSDLSYVITPYKLDTETAKEAKVHRNYRRVLNLMASMNAKDQLEKILTVCLREDVFFGTIWETSDSVIIQQLPSDYCAISVIEDNVLNVTFDFSYFSGSGAEYLKFYPEEFQRKYTLYQKDMANMRWQELDAPNSFAIKCNKEVLEYAMPPFAGILREIFDLEDYKDLRSAKEAIENYAILAMTLPLDDEGNWGIDYRKAVDFYHNLDSVLPEEIGSVLTPMPIEKISFEKSHPGTIDTVAQAEQELFTAAGVSSLIFNNAKASSNALLLSIKADQAITYSIVKSIEGVINRFIHRHSYGKNFSVTFLDCSIYNRKEMGDAFLKAATYGLPTLSFYAASQGLSQDNVEGMNFLEDTILGLKDKLRPLSSSATMSGSSTENVEGNGPGRPRLDIEDLSDAGEVSRERGEN